jgi:hypothetical protein
MTHLLPELEVLTAVLLRLELSLSVNDKEDIGTTVLQNGGNHSPNNTLSHPRRI